MTNLSAASAQWASRPDDQRFTSLDALQDFLDQRRAAASARVLPLQALTLDHDASELYVTAPGLSASTLTHWSFGQLAERAGAAKGVGFLRSLPAAVAEIPFEYALKFGDRANEEAQVYFTGSESGGSIGQVRAATGPKYGRIFDADLVRIVRENNESVGNTWTVPTPFKRAGQDFTGGEFIVDKRNTTLYASDRDVWLFLVDETRPITVGDQTYFRGFYTSNSEVGDAKFNLSTFLYSYVCANRIIWGASQVEQVSIRHTSGAPERFLEEAKPALKAISESSPQPILNAIKAAQETRIAEKPAQVEEWLQRKLGVSPIAAKTALSLAARGGDTGSGGDATNLWDVIQGGTAAARAIGRADDRFIAEKNWSSLLGYAKAGTVLDGKSTVIATDRLN